MIVTPVFFHVIAHIIEIKINRKVDLVEKGQLKDFALQTAKHNLQQIYG